MEVSLNCQFIELIRGTYPIAFVTTFGATFGAALSFFPRLIQITTLKQLLKKDAAEKY